MFLCDNQWKLRTSSIPKLWQKFSGKRKTFFKKLEYHFLVENTKIENASFPYKFVMSEANDEKNRMASTKWTYYKEWGFVISYFIFLKILFLLKNPLSGVDLMYHGHKKQKDSLERRAVLLIFSLEVEIFGVAVQSIHQNREKWWLLGGISQCRWLWGCFSHFLLLWPCCQGFWGSSEDRYRSKRVSQMLLVCYNLLNTQNIPGY